MCEGPFWVKSIVISKNRAEEGRLHLRDKDENRSRQGRVGKIAALIALLI
jgi:hypothetical protein